jgi:hypothetical protein
VPPGAQHSFDAQSSCRVPGRFGTVSGICLEDDDDWALRESDIPQLPQVATHDVACRPPRLGSVRSRLPVGVGIQQGILRSFRRRMMVRGSFSPEAVLPAMTVIPSFSPFWKEQGTDSPPFSAHVSAAGATAERRGDEENKLLNRLLCHTQPFMWTWSSERHGMSLSGFSGGCGSDRFVSPPQTG